jgi:hypothetical protein
VSAVLKEVPVWFGGVTRMGGDSRPVVGTFVVVSIVLEVEALENGVEFGGEEGSGCTGLAVDVERERERGRGEDTGGVVDWDRDLDRGGERARGCASRSGNRVKKRIFGNCDNGLVIVGNEVIREW